MQSNTLYLPLKVHLPERTVDTLALLDSGAGTNLIDQDLANEWKLPRRKLPKPLAIRNGDGSVVENTSITDYVVIETTVYGKQIKTNVIVANLG
ncbi:hypothetical protein D9756_010590 [Leucocoprinus leucothites]|uniref:Peptidase A2 domain-containing protein n=1 Tax=Leucocoprinus leucothites TaxID=201217 RepID=A0A8H5FRW8_9AGAR|nr:hypothetical protein D9756_010590 [Leucoagaricus leucothites]